MAAAAAINRICPLAVCFLAVASSILFASPVVSGAVGKGAFVKKTVAAHAIVIFSKSYCPYCRRAKAVFSDLKKVPYVVELDQRDDGGDIQDALHTIVGRRTVPQVFIHGKHLGGSDDTIEAYENGELAKMLGITNHVSNDDL